VVAVTDQRSGGRRPFRRAIGGYRRSDVDRYIAEVEAARSAWTAELARLRKVEPLSRLGDDVADLLTSFAATVLEFQDRLTEDGERRRAEAEEYAERRVHDADRLLETARQQARQLANEMIREAEAELAALAQQQMTIADALERAARGIEVSKEAIARIQHPPVVPIRPRGTDDGSGTPGARDAPPPRFARG
jgi:hypothetical protein